MKKITLQLETLACPSCGQKIESAVRAQNGVKEVNVLFNASKVKVEATSETNPETLKSAIEAVGYEVKSLKTTEA